MNLVARVKNILLQPKTEWAVIESEQTDPKTLYSSYIGILAFIAPAASLVGALFSMLSPSSAARVGPGVVVATAITQYVLSLVMVFVIAFTADALAPSFGGRKNLNQALKLTAYAMTAVWVLPVVGWLLYLVVGTFFMGLLGPYGLYFAFLVGPNLRWFFFLLSLYSVYLFYLGAPMLMKVPHQKKLLLIDHPAVGYTVAVMLVAIVIGNVIEMINGSILRMGAVDMMGGMR